MIEGFKKKKLKNVKILGEQLRSARLKRQISIEEAELGTKVRVKYLLALESGDWNVLPSLVYVRGFVLSYAKFLKLNEAEILGLFEVESQLRRMKNTSDLSYKNTYSDTKILITPKLIGYMSLSLALISMFTYIIVQFRNFAGNPNLTLISPTDNSIIETDQVQIEGLTDNDSTLFVNNEMVPVAADGHFETDIAMHQGVNVIRVKAQNRAKKETSETLTIEYKPKTALIDSIENQ